LRYPYDRVRLHRVYRKIVSVNDSAICARPLRRRVHSPGHAGLESAAYDRRAGAECR